MDLLVLELFLAKLHIKGISDLYNNGHGYYIENHVMIIENTQSETGWGNSRPQNGLAIKVNRDSARRWDNYITFFDGGGSAGAIEGQIAMDLEYDSDYNYFLQSAVELANNIGSNTATGLLGMIPFVGSFLNIWVNNANSIWSYSQKN